MNTEDSSGHRQNVLLKCILIPVFCIKTREKKKIKKKRGKKVEKVFRKTEEKRKERNHINKMLGRLRHNE